MQSIPPEIALRLDHQISFALYASSHAMINTYRSLLQRLRLTYPQYLVMLVLWEREKATVKELGELLYLDSGTLSPLLKRMEKEGVLRRERNAADERSVEIGITEAGRALKEQASVIPAQFNGKLGLDPHTFATLREQLRQLLVALSSTETEKEETFASL
jgi:MarR family transcriptional regulator, organic hydroperoxide resistance regulator